MAEVVLGILYLAVPVLMLLVAWAAGNAIARRHERSMAARYGAVAHIRTTDIRQLIDADPGATDCGLVTSEVTFGIDHFRGFLGQLKNIFGGEVRSYQSTLDRARREAILRLLEQAHGMDCNAVANVRVDFADISGNSTMAKKASMVSIMASGTAYCARTRAQAPLAEPVSAPLGP